ncbi:transcription termination factor NusG domain protein [Bryobacterales bacterium F-183]|nr:transcription termination factor NusG domain protein [Bryobacterales bacterium F-183]
MRLADLVTIMSETLVGRWIAVQVRPKAEKMVSELLLHKGYETLLPLHNRSLHNRRHAVSEAVFPGYVFCHVGEHSSGLIVTTPGVLRLVGVAGKPEPIPAAEMQNIARIVETGLPLHPWLEFEAGDPVEVTDGPLRGCRGVIRTVRNEQCLVVSVNLLQRSVAVEVSRGWVVSAATASGR